MKQGEIWLINLDPTIGHEIKKTRPAIIVNDDSLGKLPLKVIIPITGWKDHFEVAPWMIRLEPDLANKLSKESSADCFQIRCVSEDRFVKQIGIISKSLQYEIKIGMSKVLSFDKITK